MAVPIKREIHLQDNGMCKIIEGVSRRTYYSTEEAVGLSLLRMTPGTGSATEVRWADFLAARGIAVGQAGQRTLTLYVSPAKERTIRWRRSGDYPTKDYKAVFPATLLALAVIDGKVIKSQLWLVKAGLENKLTTTLTEGVLAYFPYGNVYNHGGICWGTASLQGVVHPQDVEDAFFQSEFNADLCYPTHFGRTETTLPEIITACAGVLPAPPAGGYGNTVAGIVRHLTE